MQAALRQSPGEIQASYLLFQLHASCGRAAQAVEVADAAANAGCKSEDPGELVVQMSMSEMRHRRAGVCGCGCLGFTNVLGRMSTTVDILGGYGSHEYKLLDVWTVAWSLSADARIRRHCVGLRLESLCKHVHS